MICRVFAHNTSTAELAAVGRWDTQMLFLCEEVRALLEGIVQLP
jgi:hypothetical protein